MKLPPSQKGHDKRAGDLTWLITLIIVPIAIVGILRLLDFLSSTQ